MPTCSNGDRVGPSHDTYCAKAPTSVSPHGASLDQYYGILSNKRYRKLSAKSSAHLYSRLFSSGRVQNQPVLLESHKAANDEQPKRRQPSVSLLLYPRALPVSDRLLARDPSTCYNPCSSSKHAAPLVESLAPPSKNVVCTLAHTPQS